MATGTVTKPDLAGLLGPLLSALPAAALSARPADPVLPLLSPILRQRVQLLSNGDNESWIGLLSYSRGGSDDDTTTRLRQIAQSALLEPHPVSGEVEVDWDYDAEIRFRRLDEETLQALVALSESQLAFRLVWCTGDAAGGGDGNGWRVGEVGIVEKPDAFSSFGGAPTITEAEKQFNEPGSRASAPTGSSASGAEAPAAAATGEANKDDDDDDDDYWAQYDATSTAQTPAARQSPVPDEDDYYAQYDKVQPALDGHDPDEEANLAGAGLMPLGRGAQAAAAPPLGLRAPATGEMEEATGPNETQGAWTLAPSAATPPPPQSADLIHPHPSRPSSSDGDGSPVSVEKLEAAAARREATQCSVRRHVTGSVRSLWDLSRGSGLDRAEFAGLVREELARIARDEGDDADE